MSQGKYEYQSDFAKRYVAEGKVEGRAEGTAEGVLAVLAARGIAVDPATEARVRACADRERLDRWLRRAAVAVTLGQVFDDG